MSSDIGSAIVLFVLGLLIEIMYLTTDTLSWTGATILVSLCWITSLVYLRSESKRGGIC